MSAFLQPIDQFGNLGGAARSVGAFDGDQLSGELIDIDARNSVAIKPALARSRDQDSFGLSSGYSSTNSCFHLFLRGVDALAG